MAAAKRIGVVLSSGGAPGVYAHTGLLMALEQMGVSIAAIAGCSAGALVGGIYASGSDLQGWADTLATIRPEEYWTPDSPFQFFWSMAIQKGRGYTGLSPTDKAIEVIRNNLSAQTFETCKMPFYCQAINISRSEKTIFSEGELAPRIMSSAAIPAFFRPVEIDKELYSDGDVISMTPSEAICCKHDLDALIIHFITPTRGGAAGMNEAMTEPWTLVEIVQRLLHHKRPWYLSGKPVDITQCQCGCSAPFVVLEPELPEIAWPPAQSGEKILQTARKQALALLEPHKDMLTS